MNMACHHPGRTAAQVQDALGADVAALDQLHFAARRDCLFVHSQHTHTLFLRAAVCGSVQRADDRVVGAGPRRGHRAAVEGRRH